jgi:hypothetical protein
MALHPRADDRRTSSRETVMRKKAEIAGALAMCSLAAWQSIARAEEDRHGWEMGMRLAFGQPAGNVDARTGDTLDQTVGATVPLWFEAGWRPNRRWFLGADLIYAPGFAGQALSQSCSGRCTPEDVRIGAEVQFHFRSRERWDPWVGAGSGYEWLRIHAPGGVLGLQGWEIVNAQVGLDYASSPGFRGGPFIAVSIGEYQSWFSDAPADASPLGPLSAHAWVTLGLKAAFDLRPRPQEQERVGDNGTVP